MPRISVLFWTAAMVAAVACGDGSHREAPSASPSAQAPAAACAGAGEVAGEFARQQGLVHWPVYCPTDLPDGFRLARVHDPQDATVLGGDVSPTRDDLNPGGGTFITRLLGPGDAQLVIVQGAGAAIYVHRDTSGNLIGAGPDAPDAAVGDLAGKSLTIPTPSITAYDRLGYGHMLVGTRMSLDQVTRIAASMTPVDPSGLRLALFSAADLAQIAPDYWVVAWPPPDPTAENVSAPSVCGKGLGSVDRLSEAVVRFEFAPYFRAAPDAGGHGPFLQQLVASFPPGGAQRYIDQITAIMNGCPPQYEQKAADGSHLADVTLSRIDYPGLGEHSLVYRRSVRSPVQGADIDVALVQRGDNLAIVLRFETVAPTAAASPDAILAYARLADQQLRALNASDVSPATGVPELDRLIRATLAGDKDALASRLVYATMPCVAQGQEGSPPMCEPGQQVGDPVPAFLAAGCGGGWVTPAEAERFVRGVQKPVRFVAAGAPSSALPDPSVDVRLLFAFGPADDANGFWFDLSRGGITGLHWTCGTVTDALRFITPAISTPP